jgi:hypothetical protein
VVLRLIYWIITKGNCWKEEKSSGFRDGNGSWNDFISSMEHNFEDPLAILLAQIVMILVARLWLDFQKDQQPTVIGEIIMELFWAPIIVFLIFHALFPVESLGI